MTNLAFSEDVVGNGALDNYLSRILDVVGSKSFNYLFPWFCNHGGMFSSIVRNDLNYMASVTPLSIPLDDKMNLLVRSVVGHALRGHANFSGKVFGEASIDLVVAALEDSVRNPEICSGNGVFSRDSIYSSAQARIDEIFDFFERALNNIGGEIALVNAEGKPLLGYFGFGKDAVVSVDSLLKGAAFASVMDSAEWREKLLGHSSYSIAFDGSPLELGYGSCFLVDILELYKNGYSIAGLADSETTREEIETMKSRGIIVSDGFIDEAVATKPREIPLQNIYIRFKKGSGVSDDLAHLLMGYIAGYGGICGVRLVDHIDTLDKAAYGHSIGGTIAAVNQDEILGKFIMDEYLKKTGKELLTEDFILAALYLCVKENYPKIGLSCSSRWFFQQIASKTTVFDYYVRAVDGVARHSPGFYRPSSTIRIGFANFPMHLVPKILSERMRSYKQNYEAGFPSC